MFLSMVMMAAQHALKIHSGMRLEVLLTNLGPACDKDNLVSHALASLEVFLLMYVHVIFRHVSGTVDCSLS